MVEKSRRKRIEKMWAAQLFDEYVEVCRRRMGETTRQSLRSYSLKPCKLVGWKCMRKVAGVAESCFNIYTRIAGPEGP